MLFPSSPTPLGGWLDKAAVWAVKLSGSGWDLWGWWEQGRIQVDLR
jgi:hypothetical protein